MLNSMMINVDFKPENLFAVKQEGVIINAIHSQAFLLGDDMGRFRRTVDTAPLCACGCGERTIQNKQTKKWNKFINGHTWKNRKLPKDMINKATKSRTGLKRSKEFKLAQSKRVSGERNPNYGKIVSEETKKKMSIANSNPSIETRNKISKAGLGNQRAKGSKHSKEVCEAQSKKMKGNQVSKGYKHTKEYCETQSIRLIGNQNAKGSKHSKEVCDNQSKRMTKEMLNGKAAYMLSFIKNPSRPQVELFEIIEQLYPQAVLNYPSLNRSIDIAIPDLMIAIEYDGSYWHQDEEADLIRQEELEAVGWKFLRYVDYIPSIEKLKRDLKEKGLP